MKNDYAYRLVVESPLGAMLIQGSEKKIQYLKFVDAETDADIDGIGQADWFASCTEQLKQYFTGERTDFNLPIDPQGTDFQQRVWHALIDIKQGKVASYQQIAIAIGNEKSVRAVASANARNPIWLLIPCHRIIGGDCALRGYAGGIERKARLLALEGFDFNIDDLGLSNAKTKLILESID